MEEQALLPVSEVIAGNLVEKETEINLEAEVKKEEDRTEDDDEEFYERIEAPKFVDFTKPYTVRTDDRYWFCSRVGCDQKHEEEINPEEISRNFVLRVLAARSPNIKLRKALNQEHSRIKCPLSAPAKPSKPRIPRLAMVSSLIPDPQKKTGPGSKVGSTPKSRPVAAKYMTTPRNKMCNPNSKSFRSVQNPKTTTVDVPKSRTVAKALVFRSPKKAIVVKKSVELHTPLTKICEGMKKLAIASQKKNVKGSISKIKKLESEESSRKQLKICRSEKKSKGIIIKTQIKKNPICNKCESLDEQVVDVNLSKKEDLNACETSDASNSLALRGEMNDLTTVEDKENSVSVEDHSNEVKGGSEVNDLLNIEDKENMVSVEDHSHEVEVRFGSEQIDDGKENDLNPQDNNRFNNQPLGNKILNKEIHKKSKVVQTAMKCKKPKPTSIKPFRLRTDERGILKEANLEKKLHVTAPEKEVTKDTSVIKKTYRVPKNEKFSTNRGKEPSPTTSLTKRPESTQQRSMTSLKTRSQRVPGQQLGVINEKSCKLPSDVMVDENKSRAVSAARSTSRGKRPLTVAKEPNFHTSHLPRTCSKKIAYGV